MTFYEVDVCDEKKLDEIFTKENIDAVIHFAGYKAVGESVEKPLMYYRNNVDSTLTLCEVMKSHNVKKIVFHRVRLYMVAQKHYQLKKFFHFQQ